MKTQDGTLPTRNDVRHALHDERKKLLEGNLPEVLAAQDAVIASWSEDLRGLAGPALHEALAHWRQEQEVAAHRAPSREVEAVHRTALAIADRYTPGRWK